MTGWCFHKKLIRRRNKIYKRWKSVKVKWQVQNSLRSLYWRHVERLISDDVTNPPSSKKTFRSFIKARISDVTGTSPLKDARELFSNSKEQEQLLNNQFCCVFSPRDTATPEEFKLRCPHNQSFPRTQTAKTSSLQRWGEETVSKSAHITPVFKIKDRTLHLTHMHNLQGDGVHHRQSHHFTPSGG